ncbi:alpha/beta hydrolase [Nocardioides KLBMP 9356]|uniref:Alpha/beta hydrolase n=1 Tax=Nocardioides potassii TaxID=2911371 RepID=A0ABS9HH01_9ACTN|nr:alpha/beta hydrolase [Nocardioides potassii]MCF6379490.1 alpha/beta hydrolase [Nocardioides potassii]
MPSVPPQDDVLGPDYRVETITLPPDDEGPVFATVVTLEPEVPNGRAVLHVHGFADYFFHDEYARWWVARGYTFYALDLRKYGRSLRDHQTPHYVSDLSEYFAEIDLTWWRITERDGFRHVVLSAHSTGGLTMSLWADERRHPEMAALVLNSPWFDMQGAAWLRSRATGVAIERLGTTRPMREIPRKVSEVYGRSLHAEHGGEWDYDLAWKPLESRPVYIGWLRAVRHGHARLHRGLDVPCPAVVLSSARSFFGEQTDETASTHDIVLDVEQIRRWASSVGRHVTSIAIEGAMHDVVLSRPEVREQVYAVLDRWLGAWVPEG